MSPTEITIAVQSWLDRDRDMCNMLNPAQKWVLDDIIDARDVVKDAAKEYRFLQEELAMGDMEEWEKVSLLKSYHSLIEFYEDLKS